MSNSSSLSGMDVFAHLQPDPSYRNLRHRLGSARRDRTPRRRQTLDRGFNTGGVRTRRAGFPESIRLVLLTRVRTDCKMVCPAALERLLRRLLTIPCAEYAMFAGYAPLTEANLHASTSSYTIEDASKARHARSRLSVETREVLVTPADRDEAATPQAKPSTTRTGHTRELSREDIAIERRKKRQRAATIVHDEEARAVLQRQIQEEEARVAAIEAERRQEEAERERRRKQASVERKRERRKEQDRIEAQAKRERQVALEAESLRQAAEDHRTLAQSQVHVRGVDEREKQRIRELKSRSSSPAAPQIQQNTTDIDDEQDEALLLECELHAQEEAERRERVEELRKRAEREEAEWRLTENARQVERDHFRAPAIASYKPYVPDTAKLEALHQREREASVALEDGRRREQTIDLELGEQHASRQIERERVKELEAEVARLRQELRKAKEENAVQAAFSASSTPSRHVHFAPTPPASDVSPNEESFVSSSSGSASTHNTVLNAFPRPPPPPPPPPAPAPPSKLPKGAVPSALALIAARRASSSAKADSRLRPTNSKVGIGMPADMGKFLSEMKNTKLRKVGLPVERGHGRSRTADEEEHGLKSVLGELDGSAYAAFGTDAWNG